MQSSATTARLLASFSVRSTTGTTSGRSGRACSSDKDAVFAYILYIS